MLLTNVKWKILHTIYSAHIALQTQLNPNVFLNFVIIINILHMYQIYCIIQVDWLGDYENFREQKWWTKYIRYPAYDKWVFIQILKIILSSTDKGCKLSLNLYGVIDVYVNCTPPPPILRIYFLFSSREGYQEIIKKRTHVTKSLTTGVLGGVLQEFNTLNNKPTHSQGSRITNPHIVEALASAWVLFPSRCSSSIHT